MATRLPLYLIVTHNAPQMTDPFYSAAPRDYHDDRTHQESQEPDRTLVLADGVETYPCGWDNDVCAKHPDGSTITLAELVTPEGHVIDRKWGYTEAIKP